MVGQDLILPCGYIFHSVSFLYKLYFLHVLADTKFPVGSRFHHLRIADKNSGGFVLYHSLLQVKNELFCRNSVEGACGIVQNTGKDALTACGQAEAVAFGRRRA